MEFKLSQKVGAKQPYHFTLVGDNGEIVMQSENYVHRQDALDTLQKIRVGALGADVVDETDGATTPRSVEEPEDGQTINVGINDSVGSGDDIS